MRNTQSRTAQSRWRRLIGGIAAALLASVVGVTTAAAPASAIDAGYCEFGVLLTARGTNAPAGAGLAHNNRIWTTGGHGDELLSLAWTFKGTTSPLPTFVASVNYPAAGGADYVSSVMTGRANLVNEINWLVQQCGAYPPVIFLAGHSQGAVVMHDALLQVSGQPNLSATAKASIRGIVLFGDPNFTVNKPWNAPGSPTNAGGLLGSSTVYNNVYATYRTWGWPYGSASEGWVYKIRSYCYAGDYFCNSGTGSNAMTIHNQYGEKSTTDAWHWLEYQVNAF